MKVTPEFRPNPAHRYTLPPGVLVQSAKLGRRQVDIWQEPEAAPIFRGEPKQEVGRASLRLWRFVVSGMMSGTATSEAAARSEGERRATEGKGKAYRLSPADQEAEAATFESYIADIERRFPT